MSLKKIFWFLLIISIISYCFLKEKNPEAVFENALKHPRKVDSEEFCAALNKMENNDIFYYKPLIKQVFLLLNDQCLRCYIKRARESGYNVKENFSAYVYEIFLDGNEKKIDLLLRNGVDPNLNLQVGKERKPLDAILCSN